MRSLSGLLALLAVLPVAACGPSVSLTEGTGASTTTTTTQTSTTTTTTNVQVCSLTLPCGTGLFCHYADGLCGKNPVNGLGVCEPVPISDCGQPVEACGCDGQVGMACGDAVGIGSSVDIATPDHCTQPAGTFVCGNYFCDPSESQFCLASMNLDTCGTDYACQPMPTPCDANPTCACLQQNGIAFVDCVADPSGGLRVQGPAGDSPSCP